MMLNGQHSKLHLLMQSHEIDYASIWEQLIFYAIDLSNPSAFPLKNSPMSQDHARAAKPSA